MPFVRHFEKGEMPIETTVNGTVVKGYFTAISKRDYTVVLEDNPECKGGTHIPLLGGPIKEFYCDDEGNPTEKCLKSARKELEYLWGKK